MSGFTGLAQVAAGTHVLNVSGVQNSAVVGTGATPAASLTAVPIAISSGQQSRLDWATTSGTYIDVVLDHGVTITPGPTGAVTVSPTVTTTYHLFVLTEEGGATAEATVWVDEFPGLIFIDGFESGTTNAWN